MPTLYVLRGLPASGKTTRAMEMVSKGVRRVNRDELRHMIDNDKYNPMNESYIIGIETHIANFYLRLGLDVVVDDTNMKQYTIDMWTDLAEAREAKLEIIWMDVPLMTCIERDAMREKPVGRDAILKMFEAYNTERMNDIRKDERG